MFALTIDQRRSRSAPDLVPGLLDALADIPTLLPFERTVGDEIQGLLDDPDAVLRAVLVVLRQGGWHVGLGIGAVDAPLPATVRAARGRALLDARTAVERAKRSPVGLCVTSTVHPVAAADAEAVLGLIGVLVRQRTATQWAVIDAVDAAATQRAAAEALGVSPQNVSQTLAASAIHVERAGYPVLIRILDRTERP